MLVSKQASTKCNIGKISQEKPQIAHFLKNPIWKNGIGQPYFTDSYTENVHLRETGRKGAFVLPLFFFI